MNPDIDFKCKGGKIILLKHSKYPWSDKTARSTIALGKDVITRKDFYDYIYQQIPPVLPYLFHDYGYSLRQLFLPWLWEEFSRGNGIIAGYCFIHMVYRGYVPFVLKGLPSEQSGTRRYCYTGPESTIFDFEPPITKAVQEA